MRCVICNDDGVDAPGLRALFAALRTFADVTAVAPATEYSGVGHGAPPGEPIEVERRHDAEMGDVFVVHARPADCARLAVRELVRPRPDVLVSGINRGGNVGVDMYYSGTMAAAREAVVLGVPAVAISRLVRKELPDDWPATSALAAAVLRTLLRELDGDRRGGNGGESRARLWNVNLPHLPHGGRPKGVVRAPMATSPTSIAYDRREEAGGRIIFTYRGAFMERVAPPGTDVAWLFDDWVTVTPVQLDLTMPPTKTARLDWSLD